MWHSTVQSTTCTFNSKQSGSRNATYMNEVKQYDEVNKIKYSKNYKTFFYSASVVIGLIELFFYENMYKGTGINIPSLCPAHIGPIFFEYCRLS